MDDSVRSGSATPRSKLDQLSREDLIKVLKKLQLNVNKYKQDNEVLQKQLDEFRQEAPNGESKQEESSCAATLKAEIELLVQQRDEALTHVSEQQSTISFHQKENVALLTKLSDTERNLTDQFFLQIEEYKKTIASLHEQLAESVEHSRRLSAEYSQLKTELSSCCTEFEGASAKLAQEIQSRSELEADLNDSRLKVSQLESLNDQLSTHNSELQKQISVALERDSCADVVSDELQNRNRELEAELTKLKELHTSSQLHNEELNSEISRLQNDNAMNQPKLENACYQSSEAKTNDIEKINELNVLLEDMTRRLHEAEDQFQQSQSKCEQLEMIIDQLKQDNASRLLLVPDDVAALDSHTESVDVADLQSQITLLQGELDGYKAQADRLSGENASLQTNFDEQLEKTSSLAAECERLRTQITASSEVASSEHNLKAQLAAKSEAVFELQEENQLLRQALTERREMYEKAFEENQNLASERAAIDRRVEELVAQNERLTTELGRANDTATRLEAEKSESSKRIEQLNCELRDLQTQITRVESKREQEKEAHELTKKEFQKTVSELSKAKQNVEQQSMMNLEMADYQRCVNNMQQEVELKKSDISRLNDLLSSKQKETDSMNKELEATRSQRTKAEETEKKLKAALIKAKKDIAESKKTIETKDESIEELNKKFLNSQGEMDLLKVELSLAAAEKESMNNKLVQNVETKERQILSLETQRTRLQMDLEAAQNDLVNLKQEYEAYKVRVHNVLKQQQQKKPLEDELVLEKEHLTKTVQLVQEKLQDVTDKFSGVQFEMRTLNEEHNVLLQKYKDLQLSASQKETALKSEIEKLLLSITQLNDGHSKVVKQLTAQGEQARLEFQEQIAKAKHAYGESVKSYDQRIGFLESELYSLHRQHANCRQTDANLRQTDATNVLRKSSFDHSDSHFGDTNSMKPLNVNVEGGNFVVNSFSSLPPSSERHPGEGSESPRMSPSKMLSSPPHITGLTPLDELIAANHSFDTASVVSGLTSTPSVSQLEAAYGKLSKAIKRIEHLNEVLNESESNNARLAEQAKVLKEEIRRMERNKEREQHLANIEYLKNVILKFLALKPGDERSQLLPVLTTMLRLSTDETSLLSSVATGKLDGKTDMAGWSNYLHRWSGMT